MNKLNKLIISLILSVLLINFASSDNINSTITITPGDSSIDINALDKETLDSLNKIKLDRIITRGELFEYVFNDTYYLDNNILNYSSISLNFLDKNNFSNELNRALKIAVLTGVINNSSINFNPDSIIDESWAKTILYKTYDVKLAVKSNINLSGEKLSKYIKTAIDEYRRVNDEFIDPEDLIESNNSYSITKVSNFAILDDVFNSLKNSHIDKGLKTDEELVSGAIKGLANEVGDKYTVYFPPSDSASFKEHLEGEYEGIGAYIDSEEGTLKIISPIEGGPAFQAGIKSGDIITKIDDYILDDNTNLDYAISLIKGKAGTKVNLEILRNGNYINYEITRDKIRIKFVEYREEGSAGIIKIRSFGIDSFRDFEEVILNKIDGNDNIDRVVLDLRNNPGGSLSEVVKMLSFFVDKGDSVAYIEYTNGSETLLSEYDYSSYLEDKQIIILINNGSASASEIMAGTIKDYIKSAKIIGETSYGKGSVQSIKTYSDNSSLKYTVAKWYTGKTNTGIDGIGIIPHYEVISSEDDNLNGVDSVLDYALNIKY